MAKMSKSTQLLARTALVTGSTIATLIGAQTLATMDQQQAVMIIPQPAAAQPVTSGAQTLATTDQQKTVTTDQQTGDGQAVNSVLETSITSATIAHVSPTIVVLSGDNQDPVNPALLSSAANVPPAPQANQPSAVILQPTAQTIQPTPQILQVNPQYSQPSPVIVQQFPVFRSRSSR